MMPTYKSSKRAIRKGDSALDVVLRLPVIFPKLGFLQVEIYPPKVGAKTRMARARLPSTKAKESVHHDAKQNQKIILRVDRLADSILELISSLPKTRAIGINSVCWMRNGKVRHIPMMDFKSKPSPDNLTQIKKCLVEIGQSGFLLQSGRSFHFYGTKLLREEEWVKFLGDSLLVEFADSRWIGHSLLEQRCNLRFTTSERKRKNPVVCALLTAKQAVFRSPRSKLAGPLANSFQNSKRRI